MATDHSEFLGAWQSKDNKYIMHVSEKIIILDDEITGHVIIQEYTPNDLNIGPFLIKEVTPKTLHLHKFPNEKRMLIEAEMIIMYKILKFETQPQIDAEAPINKLIADWIDGYTDGMDYLAYIQDLADKIPIQVTNIYAKLKNHCKEVGIPYDEQEWTDAVKAHKHSVFWVIQGMLEIKR